MGLAKAQGNLASEINYRTMAKIAQDALPKIRNALEFIVIGAFPVIVLMALVSGSAMGSIVRSYVTLLVTIQVWPALSSIVNYLMITYDAYPFGVIASQFGGNSLQAAALIRETGATSQAMAGALMCAVPVIAYALVRAGDVAVGQLVGGLTAPAQSAASSQGASLAAGNVSQGNVQLSNVQSNNTSANKFDRSIAASHPGTLVSTSAFGSVTRSDEGQVTGMTRTPVNFGVSSTTTQSFTRGHASSNVSQMTSSWADAARFSFTQSATSSDSVQRGFAHALRDAINKEIGTMDAYSRSERTGSSLVVDRGVELASTDSVGEGISVDTGGKLGVESSIEQPRTSIRFYKQKMHPNNEPNVKIDSSSYVVPNSTRTEQVIPELGDGTLSAYQRYLNSNLNAGVSFKDAQDVVDRALSRQGTQNNIDSSRAFELVNNAVERVATSHNDESVRSAARSFASSLGKIHQAGREETRALSSDISAMSSVMQNDLGETTTIVDGSVGAMKQAIESYKSPEEALRSIYSESAAMQMGANVAENQKGKEYSYFGPQTIVSARELNKDFTERAEVSLEETARKFQHGIPDSLPENNISEVMSEINKKSEFENRKTEILSGFEHSKNNLDFERGILLISQEAYHQEASDKNFALRNAFLGAWGYRSGEQVQEDLRNRAEDLPELKDAIEGIGKKENIELTETDWLGLVRIARQPRGIRLGN